MHGVCVFVVYSCTFSYIHEEESKGELLMHRHTPVYRFFAIHILVLLLRVFYLS